MDLHQVLPKIAVSWHGGLAEWKNPLTIQADQKRQQTLSLLWNKAIQINHVKEYMDRSSLLS